MLSLSKLKSSLTSASTLVPPIIPLPPLISSKIELASTLLPLIIPIIPLPPEMEPTSTTLGSSSELPSTLLPPDIPFAPIPLSLVPSSTTLGSSSTFTSLPIPFAPSSFPFFTVTISSLLPASFTLTDPILHFCFTRREFSPTVFLRFTFFSRRLFVFGTLTLLCIDSVRSKLLTFGSLLFIKVISLESTSLCPKY
jgi:hypothetical protein